MHDESCRKQNLVTQTIEKATQTIALFLNNFEKGSCAIVCSGNNNCHELARDTQVHE